MFIQALITRHVRVRLTYPPRGREQHSPSLTDDPKHSLTRSKHDVSGGKVQERLNEVIIGGKKAVIQIFLLDFLPLSPRSVVDVNKNGKTQKQNQTWAFY